MKNSLKIWLPGILISAVLLISNIVFFLLVSNTSLLSAKWLIPAAVVLAALTVGVYFLVRKSDRLVRMIVGGVLALIIIVAEAIGAWYIAHGASALNEITTPQKEFAEIGVYVRSDDPAADVSDAKDYSFGILGELDRDNTDAAVKELSALLEKEPSLTPYAGIIELTDALICEKAVDAIIINSAFLELLEDIEGHENDMDGIRQLYALHIETEGVITPQIETKTPKKDDSFILYITGIDTRSSRISKKSRSDVNILAAVNTETGQIALISTPRDYYVPLSISNGIPDKLTHSGVYGTQVSIDTMEMLYGIEIDYYFKLNFYGFKDIIDALGGITVNSNYDFTAARYTFKKGPNEVDGEAALAFARERYSIGGDRQRGKHQLEVVKGVINKAVSPALLKNYTSILDSIKGSFETSIPYDEIAKLVRDQLDKGTKWNMVSYAVNGTGATRKPYSLSQKAYVMIPDEDTVAEAKRLMEQVLSGEEVSEPA